MNRRSFIGTSAAATVGVLLSSSLFAAQDSVLRPQPRIPRWRGFNLTEMAGGKRGQRFRKTDFQWMAEWGFNFARLPCSYWAWSSKENWLAIDEEALKPLDEAIAFGLQYGIHINLGLYRIPGYCVTGRELEPAQLFDAPRPTMLRALDAATHHWRHLAQRYKNVSAKQLSFELLNEPPVMSDQSRYLEIARTLISAIREARPDRLIFVDGADLGETPVSDLLDAGIAQSTRGYLPKMAGNSAAVGGKKNEIEPAALPTWPLVDKNGVTWDREKLRAELITKWQPLTERGAPVHVGAWGCVPQTPHDVCLAWMTDLLALWKEAGWGWALGNLRGGFGPLDSGRTDVAYEDFRSHKLDRKMLDLLLAG